MKRLLFYILSGISILLLHSCIAEDLTKCNIAGDSSLGQSDTILAQLKFTYIDDDGPNTLFNPAVLNDGTLFVFDSSDSLLAQQPIYNASLTGTSKVEVPIGSEMYHYVVWFFEKEAYRHDIPHPSTHSENQKMKSNSFVHLDSDPADLSHLVFGQIRFHGDSLMVPNKIIEIPLELNYNQINFTMDDPAGDNHSFSIRDNNGSYTIENNFVAESNYISYAEVNAGTRAVNSGIHTVNVLRLHSERIHPELSIVNGNNDTDTIYGGKLMPLLRAAYPDADVFQRKHKFDLKLIWTERGIAVVVNGWEIPFDGEGNIILGQDDSSN